MVFADPWHGPSPAWDGVSDVGRANEEHLGQVKRHILSHAIRLDFEVEMVGKNSELLGR